MVNVLTAIQSIQLIHVYTQNAQLDLFVKMDDVLNNTLLTQSIHVHTLIADPTPLVKTEIVFRILSPVLNYALKGIFAETDNVFQARYSIHVLSLNVLQDTFVKMEDVSRTVLLNLSIFAQL